MMLLDEATSALDAPNQKKVAENLAAEQKRLGFSMVQIAHRLETLQARSALCCVCSRPPPPASSGCHDHSGQPM